jgi:8-oxo-dGTP pyrophosphatase MutT (NUDIX family)
MIQETRYKVAVIVWTVDKEGTKRFLLRHNKPFDGYNDEWTLCFGSVEDGEEYEVTAIREVYEEYGISEIEQVKNINYKVIFDTKKGHNEAHFFAIRVKDLDIKISLNEESIGYDWMKIEDAKKIMQFPDESIALDLVD